MTPDEQHAPARLPASALERIDAVCTRFERSWRGGARPDLAAFLEGDGPQRAALFRELLKLELEYRLKEGEHPTVDEYRRRFPDEADPATIQGLLGEASTRPIESSPAPPGPSPAPPPPALSGALGRYRIEYVLGEGAFGTVYRAEDRELRRPVALKIERAAGRAAGDVDAFLAEARALASLDHPAIIPVYDVGRVDGRSYIVTKLIEGKNLSERLRASLPTRDEAARWAAAVARALQAAHDRGLVHRDVKPSNIMVAGSGDPFIGDFGLALRGEHVGRGPRVIGTPAYMSPEQARGEGHLADARSDVFSLGAVLYEMLAGRPPFKAESASKTIRQVLEHEPVPPARLNPSVGRDLDTICMKCLEKHPERRYASAGALADDLQRWLDHRPILARPAGPIERLARWSRRNRATAAALGLAVATVAVGFAAVTASYLRAEAALREEARQRREVQLREKAERWERYRSEMMSASNALVIDNAAAAREALEAAPPEYRDWEWRHLSQRLETAEHAVGAATGAGHVLFSADARRALRLDADRPITTIDLLERRELRDLRFDGPARDAVLSPDGCALAFRDGDRALVVWNVAEDRRRFRWEAPAEGIDFWTFSADGSRLAACLRDAGVQVLDAADGREHLRLARGPWSHAAFSPDGRRLATVGGDGQLTVQLWDAADGRPLARLDGHTASVAAILFSPRGDLLAACEAYPGSLVRLWDVESGRPAGVLSGHTNQVFAWAFSPDGKRLATGSYDQTVRLWDVAAARPIAALTGHKGWVISIAFSPDGRCVVSGSADGSVRLWDAAKGQALAVLHGRSAGMARASYTPDGGTIVGSLDGEVRFWDARRVELGGVLRGHESFVYDVAFHPDGRRVASAAWDGTVRIWDATTGHTHFVLQHPGAAIVSSVVFHPDGKRLASAARDGRIHLWDVDDGREIGGWPLPEGDGDVRLQFSPRGDVLAAGHKDRTLHVWKVPDAGSVTLPAEAFVLPGHDGWVEDCAFDPNGSWIATGDGGSNARVRIWKAGQSRPIRVLEGHTDSIHALAVSRDGRWLASGSGDGTVRLWDSRTWTLAAVLKEGSQVYGLAFTPDGARLAVGCGNNTIRLWDLAHRQPVCVLHGHEAYVHALAFSPDGTRLASASGDFTVRIWDSLSAPERAALDFPTGPNRP